MSYLSTGGAVSGNDFDILGYAASGMEAQRGALDVAARNIALAQTGDPNRPMKAYAPVFSVDPDGLSGNPFASMVKAASVDKDEEEEDPEAQDGDDDSGASDAESMSMGGDPGLVAMTGVKQTNIDDSAITQMVEMLNAQRAYEANSSVFDVGKSVLQKTLTLGQ
jgi:flagellar basal-body rod protein FlgC